MPSYACNFCRKELPTLKGLRSHQRQTKHCNAALHRLAQDSDPDSASNSGSDLDSDQESNGMDVDSSDEGRILNDEIEQPYEEQDKPPAFLFSNEPGASDSEMANLGPDLNLPPHNRPPTVEDTDSDNDQPQSQQWRGEFPGPAGLSYGEAKSQFENFQEKQQERGLPPFVPFVDLEEWELVEWLTLHVGQNATDKLLKLPIVS